MNHQHFFIVGVQRCGTSYLCKQLDSNPDVCMAKSSTSQEPRIFLQPIIDYDSYFHRTSKVRGEKSVSYFTRHQEVIPKIKKFDAQSKIVILLRNPVSRAISHYFFTKSNQLESRTLTEVFLDQLPTPACHIHTSTNPFHYIETSCYLNNLKQFCKNFDTKVVIFEELCLTPCVFNEILEFLNLALMNFTCPAVTSYNIPKCVLEHLQNYFKESIEELENYLSHDLRIWK